MLRECVKKGLSGRKVEVDRQVDRKSKSIKEGC